jgi:hypothetical protein
MLVVRIANEHVLILIDVKNYAIICVLLVAFVLMIMYDKKMKTAHALKKMNVNFFYILSYVLSMNMNEIINFFSIDEIYIAQF